MDEHFLKLNSRLDRKRDLLVMMQDRIFLNPAAKIKNVPVPEAKQPDTPMGLFMIMRIERLAQEQSDQIESCYAADLNKNDIDGGLVLDGGTYQSDQGTPWSSQDGTADKMTLNAMIYARVLVLVDQFTAADVLSKQH